MTALLVIAILILLIIGHELGHFVVAKLMRVRVVEFGLGYPPRAFRIGRWGGTEYTINWLPFGGFVRLYGEEHEELTEKQRWKSLAGAPWYAQVLILSAGVLANILIGWVLFTAAFMQGLPMSVPEGTEGARLVVNGVLPASPADAAGIQTGDRIVAVEGQKGTKVETLEPGAVIAFVQANGGKPISVTYVREDTTNTVMMIPAHAVLVEDAGRPALGVELALVSDTHMNFLEAAASGFVRTLGALKQVSLGLWGLLRDAFIGKADLSSIVGPVGLVSVVDTAVGYGLGQILGIAAFISINLAIINLIPIPALDGGRLLFVGLETVFRRQMPNLLAHSINLGGFALIILLMIIVTYQDIARLFHLG